MTMLLNIFRWLISSISLKGILIVVLLVAIVGGGWYGYDKIIDHGKELGVASQADVVKKANDRADDLQKQLTVANGKLDLEKQSYDAWKATQLAATAAAQQAQDKVNLDLASKLAKTQTDLATIKKQKDDLSKYISKANDAACTLPNGFVFLYDQSLTAANPLLALPSGTIAFAPSGLSLSSATRVLLDNNAAARANRDKVIEWQTWWDGVKKILAKYPIAPPPAPLGSK